MNKTTPQALSSNVVWHHASVTRNHREKQNNHKSVVIWFTGLSGSGKSTLAHAVEEALHIKGCRTFVLDGDNVRHGLCGDLTFADSDRKENIRRVGETAKLFIEAGIIVLTAFISPFRDDRNSVRQLIGDSDFIEVFCDCPLSVCEQRDVKGIYKKAREGAIKDFTGISSPYEPPLDPELAINSASTNLHDAVSQIINYMQSRQVVA